MEINGVTVVAIQDDGLTAALSLPWDLFLKKFNEWVEERVFVGIFYWPYIIHKYYNILNINILSHEKNVMLCNVMGFKTESIKNNIIIRMHFISSGSKTKFP